MSPLTRQRCPVKAARWYLITFSALLSGLCSPLSAQSEFRWSNPIEERKNLPDTVRHATFRSPSMEVDVGYCIYFPAGYESSSKRYPVIYLLHGGIANGNERKFLKMVPHLEALRKRGEGIEAIFVLPNGGKMGFYNMPELGSMGEDVFIRELIPHIDQTYRTIADRSGRGIEGYSGGGRATARIALEYPDLFASAIAGSGGFHREKGMAEQGEYGGMKAQPGHNAYDRARKYAQTMKPKLALLIAVGTEDYNYENNLAYMSFLDELRVPYEKLIVEGAGHGSNPMQTHAGRELVQFHKRHLAKPRE